MMRFLKFALAFGVLAAIFYFNYLNQLTYRYEVPAGGDAFNHLTIVGEILAGHYRVIFASYSLWHLLTVIVVKIWHLAPITAMAWLAPALIGFGSVSLFIFNRRFFGLTAGLVSAVIFGLMSFQPLQTLKDGGFPNVLAAATVLPLTLVAVEAVFSAKRKVPALIIALILVLLLPIAHTITALYGFLVIILLLFMEFLKRVERLPLGKLIVIVTPIVLYLIFALLVHLILTTNIVPGTQGLAKAFIKSDAIFPFVHLVGHLDNPNAIVELTYYPEYIGQAPVYLGLLGLLVALGIMASSRPDSDKRAAWMLIAWATILAVASQQVGLGFPIRLARDLAVPLILLAGVFVGWAVDFTAKKQMPKILALAIIGFSLGLGGLVFDQRLDEATRPDPLVYHLNVDSEAAKKIQALTPAKSRILVFYDDLYLSLFIGDRQVLTTTSEAAELIANPSKVASEVPKAEYVYVERRLDRAKTAVNHDGIAKSYQASKEMTLIFKLEQAEKRVYLFKVNQPGFKRPGYVAD